jgi:hypothetical protein
MAGFFAHNGRGGARHGGHALLSMPNSKSLQLSAFSAIRRPPQKPKFPPNEFWN